MNVASKATTVKMLCGILKEYTVVEQRSRNDNEESTSQTIKRGGQVEPMEWHVLTQSSKIHHNLSMVQ